MAEVIMMPRLGDTMEEGNIVGWLKKVGDKATMELESFYEGTLLHIGVPEGTIAVGALLAIIGKMEKIFPDYSPVMVQVICQLLSRLKRIQRLHKKSLTLQKKLSQKKKIKRMKPLHPQIVVSKQVL